MSARVLLNLLNELGKRDKMRGLHKTRHRRIMMYFIYCHHYSPVSCLMHLCIFIILATLQYYYLPCGSLCYLAVPCAPCGSIVIKTLSKVFPHVNTFRNTFDLVEK